MPRTRTSGPRVPSVHEVALVTFGIAIALLIVGLVLIATGDDATAKAALVLVGASVLVAAVAIGVSR